jgi:hypothetical protein
LRDERGVRPLGLTRHEAGLQHRIGGIEKQDKTGNISYDPLNHEKMVRPAGGEGGAHRGSASSLSAWIADPQKVSC